MQHEWLEGPIAKIKDAEPRKTEKREARLKVRSAIFFLMAVCLSLVVVVMWEVWNSRQYRLHDQKIAMSNLTQTLSSQAQASIKQADTVLFGLVERLEIDGMGHAQSPRIQRLLSSQRKELAQLHGLFIHDEKGQWVADSNGSTPSDTNYADREYFIFHREHPDRGPHIGPSIRNRSTGDWVIPVSRRINHPDGSFAGVVVASLYLNHFLQLYNSIDIGANGVINLMSADARIMVRRPFNEAEVGNSVANGPVFTQLLPTGPFGTGIVKSYVDGVERVVGFRRVDEYPLVIFAADRGDDRVRWQGTRVQPSLPGDGGSLHGRADRLLASRRLGEGPGRASGPDDPRSALQAAAAIRQPGGAERLAGSRVPALGGDACAPREQGDDGRAGAGVGTARAPADARTVRRLPRDAACGDRDLPDQLRSEPLLGCRQGGASCGPGPGLCRPDRRADGRRGDRRSPPVLRSRPDDL